MDFARLDAIAAKHMKYRRFHQDRELGCVYYHGARVAKGVIGLRRLVTDDAGHDDILRCAAMFHDIAKGMKPHPVYGAILAREMLQNELTDGELDEVCRLIACHGNKKSVFSGHDIWVQLLQDADILDHTGIQGIYLVMGSNMQSGLEGLRDWYYTRFDRSVEKYRSRINLEQSMAIFDEKKAFERAFYERLITEADGNYIAEGESIRNAMFG